jgi:hypothetical protein
MTRSRTIVSFLRVLRRRLAAQDGFTMVVALGVLAVTSLLIAAVYVAVDGGVQLTQRDLNGQRAYYAARAGENAFLYQLNQNPNFWSTCSNDYQPTATAVPGSTTGGMYSFVPVYNPGYTNANCSANAIAALIDTNTGSLRMEFTGYSGPPNASGTPSVKRTIVTSFRKPSPLDYLWYTDHEMEDPQLNSNCTGEKYYWQYSPSPPSTIANNCEINWITGDTMSGPVYTNDQYLIYSNASPTFGRSGSSDQVESSAPTTSVCVQSSCQRATFNGQGAVAGAPSVPLPQSVSSTQLLADANTSAGQVFTGTTTINLTGSGAATITNCPGTTTGTSCTSGWVNKSETLPSIIYVQSGTSCPSAYAASTYSTNSQGYYYGACGDVYIHGTYSQPLTIVSDHDIVIMANTNGLSNPGITTTTDGSGNPIGSATLGLVAGDFVRVMHASGVTPSTVTIDAAILTLAHSFMVDNYGNGSAGTAPKLTVHGAIAQRYRGIVGTVAGAGYVKDYHYDDRLKVLLPPFLFSLSTAGWQVSRETLCAPNASASSPGSCSYQGS